MYLEFFAAGNIIITDAEHNILALMRNVPQGEGQEPQRVGLKYSVNDRMNVGGIPDITSTRVKDALERIVQRNNIAASKKQKKKKPGDALRRGLALTITELPPMLVDHAMRTTGFDSTIPPETVLKSPDLINKLVNTLWTARLVVEEVTVLPLCKGYIVAKVKEGTEVVKGTNPADIPRKNLLYEDFHPFMPRQFSEDPAYTILQFDGFNKTVDQFYSSIEGQKLESRLSDIQAAAQKKLDSARRDQEQRIDSLQSIQILNMRKGQAIETNVERVQEAMDAVIELLEQGKNWSDIAKLIELEQARRNPVAQIIKLPLKLEKDTITLLLGEGDTEEDMSDNYDSDNEAGSGKVRAEIEAQTLEVDINLTLTPWANAGEYYSERKLGQAKEQRTVEANALAMKNVERRVAKELKQGLAEEKTTIHLSRTPYWFEKFIWFISSDGYLVLGGRDPMQSELIYQKHLQRGDVYVHADIEGARSVIVKNTPGNPDAPIPPSTLSQAGTLAVCSSSAWDSKAVMAAWWVNANSVIKSTSAGDFLPEGKFNIKEEKNFLPPAQLILGLGMMWKIGSRHQIEQTTNDQASKQPVFGTEASVVDHDSDRSAEGALEDQVSPVEEEASQEPPTPVIPSESIIVNKDSDSEDEDQLRTNPLQGIDLLEKGASDNRKDFVLSDETAKMTLEKDDETKGEENRPTSEEGDQDQNAIKKPYKLDVSNEKPGDLNDTGSQAPATQSQQILRGQQKRGKKGKMKKKAKKYKDQDEEDRAAAEELLGATAGRLRREEEVRVQEKKQADLEAARQRRRAQHERTQQATARHEAQRRRRMGMTDGEAENNENEKAERARAEEEAVQVISALAELVGTPRPGDDILEVVPVCAPYAALARLKYKVKIQPGGGKKGKAVREVIERWRLESGKKGRVDERAQDTEKMWPREIELLKNGIRPEEIINIVPVGKLSVVGVSGPGGANASGGRGQKTKGSGGGGGKGGKKGK